jgi:hypothetical protein
MRELGEVNRARKSKTGPFCSRSCSNVYRFSGKPLSQEHREKITGRRPWNLGKGHSSETKAKIAQKAKQRTGERNPNWKGGRYLRADGYYQIRIGGRYKMEHIYLMEQHLGRRMNRGEVVHHKNGNKTDNRLENLQVMTISEHMKHHHPQGVVRKQRKEDE